MAEPRFEIRPLGTWDRPVTDPRKNSGIFRASWDDTITLLLAEVDHLGAALVVVQVDATDADVRRDGMLKARARVDFPGVKVSFESTHGPLSYATDAYEPHWSGDMPGWQANVRAIALGLQALRAVDRYGITRSGEQYRGWTAITAQPFAHGDLTIDEAERVLQEAAGLLSGLDMRTESMIASAYRVAARKHHPDAGGNAEAFQLITRARDILLAAVRGGDAR